jgi:hypothetical protein
MTAAGASRAPARTVTDVGVGTGDFVVFFRGFMAQNLRCSSIETYTPSGRVAGARDPLQATPPPPSSFESAPIRPPARQPSSESRRAIAGRARCQHSRAKRARHAQSARATHTVLRLSNHRSYFCRTGYYAAMAPLVYSNRNRIPALGIKFDNEDGGPTKKGGVKRPRPEDPVGTKPRPAQRQ